MNLVEHHNFLVQVLAPARPFTWENATRTPSVCSASDTNYEGLAINNAPKIVYLPRPYGRRQCHSIDC